MSDPNEPTEPSEATGPTGPTDASAASDQGAGRDLPEVGSVGEEAAKLFGALTDWARDSGAGDPDAGSGAGAGLAQGLGALADQAAATFADLNAHVATGAPECTYCPVCRTVHIVRGATPEVKAHLATAASSFLQAMAGVLASVAPPPAAHSQEFERIDLEDDGFDGDGFDDFDEGDDR